MKNKLLLLTLILLSLSLSSCTDVFSKKEAYCFSAIFDKSENNYIFSVFCKVSSEDEGEKTQVENLNFDFIAESPVEAIKRSEDHNYEIYYKSCTALFFSDTLSESEIYDILVYILNDTKYQSYVYIFKDRMQIDALKQEAEQISINEKIDFNSKEKFLTLTEYIKENNF